MDVYRRLQYLINNEVLQSTKVYIKADTWKKRQTKCIFMKLCYYVVFKPKVTTYKSHFVIELMNDKQYIQLSSYRLAQNKKMEESG